MTTEFVARARAKRNAVKDKQLERAAQYIDSREVTALLPYCHRHVADRITKKSGFPAPVKFAGKSAKRFWKAADVLAWIAARSAA